MSSNRPPTAPNLDQIVNRIALGMSKQARLLSSLNKHRPPTSSPQALSSSTTRKGFSSLSSTTVTTTSSLLERDKSESSEQDADLSRSYFQNPNAGVGFHPSSSTADTSKGSKEDRLLKTRLLGRGGGARTGGNAQRKRAAAPESESEEELGRTALGKTKDWGPGRGEKRVRVDSAREVRGGEAAGKGSPDENSRGDRGGSQEVIGGDSLDLKDGQGREVNREDDEGGERQGDAKADGVRSLQSQEDKLDDGAKRKKEKRKGKKSEARAGDSTAA